MANLLQQLDAQITELLRSWNIYTTVIAVIIAGFVLYPIFFAEEPDTHPFLLARQGRPSPVRNPGESAVYRSLEAPHGYPLRSGLNVKEPGAPRWTPGKDGDLRDIWRAVVRGGEHGEKGLIMSVFGKEAAIEHDLQDISRAINVIGQQLKASGGERVGIYLPNSIEYLSTVFASAFYGLSPVLLPYNQPLDRAVQLMKQTGVDCLVASAGSLPLEHIHQGVPDLKQIIWVVERTSQHMDWTGSPEGAKGTLNVAVWHDIVEHHKNVAADLPGNESDPGHVVQVWPSENGPADVTEFSQRNLVAAISALGSALPQKQRYSPSDLVLPADTFSQTYVLCQTLAALFAHASLAINSVAGAGVDLALASRSVSPTIIIASSESLVNLHQAQTAGITNSLQKVAHISQAQAMTAGRMPTDGLLFKLVGPQGGATGSAPGKLRLIFATERIRGACPALSSTMLSDLRIFTRARICYALTASKVAGAVAQTNLYDYRRDDRPGHSHFGVPLSSVEIRLVNARDAKVDGNTPEGEIVVTGPAVAGGEARLGAQGTFREDCTLAYA